jgi:hypothetical protein
MRNAADDDNGDIEDVHGEMEDVDGENGGHW